MSNPVDNIYTPFIGADSATDIPSEKLPNLNDLHNFTAKPINDGTAPSFWDKVIEKVKEVALVVFVVAISSLLFWVNPTICAFGFLAGIIFEDQVRSAIQKIKDVWSSQKVTGALITTVACALSMPVTLATASLLWSAHFGSLLSEELHPLSNENEKNPHLVEVLV